MKRRYLKGLIPEDKRILQNIFYGSKSRKNLKPFIWWKGILALLIGVLAFKYSNNIFSAIILSLPSLLLIPKSESYIENVLILRLNKRIKIIISIALIIFSIPVSVINQHIQDVNEEKKLIAEKIEREQIEKARIQEAIRKDSLSHYIKLLNSSNKDIDQSLLWIEKADQYTKLDQEKNQVITLRSKLYSRKIDNDIKKGNYEQALAFLNDVLEYDSKNENNYYRRAICYRKLKEPQKAVNDLKTAMSLGSTSATKLYNTINPLRKRIIYYVTRCCDGTTSNAKGRGACSWHGGVCNWNEPVYEEYREYE